MPQIIVMADGHEREGDAAVMFRERVNVSDFESSHFQAQLVERLGWAVGDAAAVERPPQAPAAAAALHEYEWADRQPALR